jgi:hypothetical protein
MNDGDALELLAALAAYAAEYGNGGNADMTVRELAGDLIDSLPRGAVPITTRQTIESTFGRDALT